MCDYAESSQLHSWLYESPDMLHQCRSRANRKARKILSLSAEHEKAIKGTTSPTQLSVVESFACGYFQRKKKGEPTADDNNDDNDDSSDIPTENPKGHAFLDPEEEALLVSFYASFLPSLIGPQAQVRRLQREPKVTATAALLMRRFFLSNSVMFHDPKAIMVAAAFLGSKIEDAMTDIRYLEDGTNAMNAKCTVSEIIPAELSLLSGIHFDCLCFHPYKAVVALTEDLRTFLKSEKGKNIILMGNNTTISGRDLEPMYDMARQIVDDVIVSDIPLLYNPGQIGLAALMVANEDLASATPVASADSAEQQPPSVLQIDFMGYVRERFRNEGKKKKKQQQVVDHASFMESIMNELCVMIRGLKEGKYGCANHNIDKAALKAINKKLKKVKVWGVKEKSSSKKRKHEE